MAGSLQVGIIMACHNRVALTAKWLESLSVNIPANWDVKLIVVDDGSTDGTAQLLACTPVVTRIEKGNGDWYWAR